uniref:K Homology domain-containing protein n=1 Tax=Dunaliella tertiolecta TaxID=3047 RepID=A0A6S8LM00_DUNTE
MKRNFSQVDGPGDGGKGSSSSLPIIIKLVCPHDRSGSVIGKGGDVVKSIRTSTGTRIKIEDTVPGLKERAVTVSAPDKPNEPCCPTDEALIRLIARVVELEGPDGKPTLPEEVEVKIIVDRGFVGQIVGKGGSHVSQIRSQTGANINTMPPTVRSPLVADAEQMIKISGPYEGAKQAVHLIVERVRSAIAKGQMPLALSSAPPPALPGQAPAPAPIAPPYGAPPVAAAAPPAAQIETVYRILMPDYRVGGLIGKGGEHLRRIRTSTRAEVHVDSKLENVPERVVVCKSQEPADSQWCGAAEALMKCTQHMLHDKPGYNDNKDAADAAAAPGPKQVRLVAQAKQMGAVIGMKGATIKQLAQDFRCKLNVIKGDLAPGLGTQHDEVLLIEGMQQNILSAVRVVTMLLRGIMVRQQSEQHAPPPPAPLPAPPVAPAAPSPWAPPRAAAPSPYQPGYVGAPAYVAPAPYAAAAPPPTYASAPPPATYSAVPPPTVTRTPAPPQPPTYPQPGPTFVPSATPYTAEPGAAAAQRTAVAPPTSAAPVYGAVPPPQPAPPTAAATASNPWAAYAVQQPQQAQPQPQAVAPAYATPAAPVQPATTYSAAPPASSYASDAAALAAQMYAGSYQQPQPSQQLQQQQPQPGASSQPVLVMYSNGTTGPAPQGTVPATSAAPPSYATYTQPPPQQQQPQQYTQYAQQPAQQASGYAGYANYAPSPSPAPAK